MPQTHEGIKPYEKALRITHEGLRSARENPDEVRKVAEQLGVSFFDVIAIAIASEIVLEFHLDK
jgi:hypothetical protein